MTQSNRPTAAEQQALTLACQAFADATRHYQAAPHASTKNGDAWIRFTIAGKRIDMPVLIKAGAHGANAIVNRMVSQPAHDDARPLMLVTQHVTPKLAESLIAANIPFLDTAGNVYLQEPEATIMIVGRAQPTLNRTDQTSRSTTPKGLRVTFALLTRPGLAQEPYRTIAAQSAVALNTVNLAMDDLMERGLVVVKGGQRVIADRRRLIEDWVTLYPTRLRPKLGSRRFISLRKEKDWYSEARVGGETGADMLTHEIKPASLTLYVHGGITPNLMAKGLLRPANVGHVEILDAFWPEKAEAGWNLPNREVVHPLLVYADLIMSGDDRHRAVAQTLYDRYLASDPA
ncbi:type IV toxin-antitoxin system AbiEi family antitoxin [Caballeronia sp. BR00000012568055]|uniref:type IV toxin-antitoxin system AbiEi family antitoxin n=1 Tax=Caballeronia sp. BR00000012568055 TaxID=2918761 RepID=UPI0023F87420|nr:type IV toxin-antitoxin system AbiEi family antitoxin [Caballeronia sp. BR00000012568055]